MSEPSAADKPGDGASSAGLSQNQMLQASHHILALLETSKEQVEDFVDSMPNVFAIIDEAGTIIKGNTSLATLLGLDLEDTLGDSLRRAFKPVSWEIFCFHLKKVLAQPGEEASFELPLDATGKKEHIFSWTVRPFPSTNNGSASMITVFGVDVTKIRSYERQLSHIFSSIPLGIMRIDCDLRVQSPYSQFTVTLLGRADLEGRSVHELLFEPAWEHMSLQDREHVQNLSGVVGFASFQFDMVRDALPRQVTLPSRPGAPARVIGINYDAIVQDDMIEGLLLILEDRTELERIKTEDEARRREEESIVVRFVEVRRLEPHSRRAIQMDLEAFFEALAAGEKSGDMRQYLRTMHGIKGTARIAQLTRLKEVAHATEAFFLALNADEKVAWLSHRDRLQAVTDEWRDLHGIMRALQVDTGGSSAISHEPSPLVNIQPSLRMVFDETARSLRKQARLVCDFGDVQLVPVHVRKLKEALLHLINNALDHGIETSEERQTLDKSEEGTLRITARQGAADVQVDVTDDGRGIDGQRLAASAVRKGLLTQSAADALTPAEKIELIFGAGTSIKEVATEISGRGIGLDAVRVVLQELGGSIDVQTALGVGTTFVIRFKK